MLKNGTKMRLFYPAICGVYALCMSWSLYAHSVDSFSIDKGSETQSSTKDSPFAICNEELSKPLSNTFEVYIAELASSLERMKQAIPEPETSVPYFEESLEFVKCAKRLSERYFSHRHLFYSVDTQRLREHDDLMKYKMAMLEKVKGSLAAALDKAGTQFQEENLQLTVEVHLETLKYFPSMKLLKKALETIHLSTEDVLKLIKIGEFSNDYNTDLRQPLDFSRLIQLVVASHKSQKQYTLEAIITYVMQRAGYLTEDFRRDRIRALENAITRKEKLRSAIL